MSIPSNRKTWVVVADGEKALILENEGTDPKPRLEVVSKREFENPPTTEQATDRPGRMPDTGNSQMSAMDETDWHEFEKERFAKELAEKLDRAVERGRCERLILVAAPQTLGVLRDELAGRTADAVGVEIDKNLTNHPVGEIEKLLRKELGW